MSRAEEFRRVAESVRENGDWIRADDWFRRALAEDVHSSRLHLAYGAFLAERQEIRRAIDHLMHGLDAATTSGDLGSQAVAFADLAAIYRQIGEFDLARRFQRQVLAIRQQADAGDLLAWSADALLANKTPLAESLAHAAWNLAEDGHDLSTQADCFGVLGMVAARRGRHRRAISLLIQAARRHHALRETQALGTDYANLGEVCGLIGRLRWQRAFYATASHWFQQAGMPQSRQQMAHRLRAADVLKHLGAAQAAWN